VLRSRVNSSRTASFSLLTKTEMGRVVHVDQVDDLGGEAPPAARRFGPQQHEHLGGGRRGVAGEDRRGVGGRVELDARPHEGPHPVVVEPDLRTVELVVDVPLAVEFGHRFERERLDQAARDAAGGLTGVVPALEGHHQQASRSEIRRVRQPESSPCRKGVRRLTPHDRP
jgi:hypothetical protein